MEEVWKEVGKRERAFVRSHSIVLSAAGEGEGEGGPARLGSGLLPARLDWVLLILLN